MVWGIFTGRYPQRSSHVFGGRRAFVLVEHITKRLERNVGIFEGIFWNPLFSFCFIGERSLRIVVCFSLPHFLGGLLPVGDVCLFKSHTTIIMTRLGTLLVVLIYHQVSI